MNGEIVSIWIKRAHHGKMDPVQSAELAPGRGLIGNANQGGKRQITVIAEEAWQEAQREVDAEVDPSARRANVLVRGVDLENSRGKTLRLGSCTVLLYGETRPCEMMEAMQPGLREALKPRWRGGAFGEIVEGGIIRVGDPAGFAE